VVFGDQFNQSGSGTNIGKIDLRPGGTGSEPRPARRTVLMFMSNPRNTTALSLSEEARAISNAVQPTTFRDYIDIRTCDATRIGDVAPELMRHRPAIVHFSGHGSGDGGLILGDVNGVARAVPPDAMARLFGLLGQDALCVVLNACLTVDQAHAIAQFVPSVVGMSRAVSDRAAIEFAAAFYQALGFGQSVRIAFEAARLIDSLHGRPANETPTLIDPRNIADRLFLATATR
jgi:hypothetical protein